MLVMYLSILNPLERNETKVGKSQQNEQKTLLLTGGRWGVGWEAHRRIQVMFLRNFCHILFHLKHQQNLSCQSQSRRFCFDGNSRRDCVGI